MKILIADDNPMWQTLLAGNVKQWNLQPILACDGRQAIEQLQNDESIRIALIDWQMPFLDGLEVCRQVKANVKRGFTYIVMLTGRDSKSDVVKGLEAGVDEYLTKPVDMDVLRSRLKAARRVIEAIPPSDWARPRIEGYSIDSILGRGAFATVWEGKRLRDDHPVAIKVLRVDLTTATVQQRFAHEIDVMKRLDHPYITPVFDGRVDDRVGYIIMDLNAGGTLGEYQQQSSLKGKQRVDLIRKVCEGIHHAHEQGVIHRDLKFANVMMSGGGDPRIVDFGLSKSLFTPPTDDGHQTIEGTVMGTPLFMSPEQARGETSRIDLRTDIYATATMLYIMLLKTHPHPLNGRDNRAIIRAISQTGIRRPESIKPNFNPALSRILTKALAADPGDRYETAAEFAAALGQFLGRR